MTIPDRKNLPSIHKSEQRSNYLKFFMDDLQKRVIELSFKHQKPHIGSCLTSVGLIDKIYSVKKKDEPFILSNGHAGLALFCVLEKYEKKDAEKLCLKYGTHPRRCLKDGIWVTTGSLGHGLPIAVGMALANPKRNVYVLTSDGEMAEGSMWEALRIAADLRLENLRITVDANGHGAYSLIDADLLDLRMNYFYPSLVIKTNTYDYPEYLNGIKGHYTVLDEAKYEEVMKC